MGGRDRDRDRDRGECFNRVVVLEESWEDEIGIGAGIVIEVPSAGSGQRSGPSGL